MNSAIQARLLGAIYACMRPLARVLLRSGITYRHFADAAKSAFVHEALLERDAKGRLTNVSRVAVRTGLSRKEVRRVIEMTVAAPHEHGVRVDHSGPPARVLFSWHSDARFIGKDGTPLDLRFEDGDPSFSDLVRAVGGDVPAGAVRAELFRAGAMIELANGSMRPTKRYFVPGDIDEKAITILSGILFPMISAVEHNSNPKRTSAGFIQRFAFGKLGADQKQTFQAWSRAESTRFIESIDDWLVSNSSTTSDGSEASEDISGVGVFYYEGPPAEALAAPEPGK